MASHILIYPADLTYRSERERWGKDNESRKTFVSHCVNVAADIVTKIKYIFRLDIAGVPYIVN